MSTLLNNGNDRGTDEETRNKGNRNGNKNNKKLNWFLLHVIVPYVPIIVSIILYFFTHRHLFNIGDLIGEGELVICSFSISLAYLIKLFQVRNNANNNDNLYLTILFISFFQIISYSGIKAARDIDLNIVVLISAFCFVSSVFMSYKVEKHEGGLD